jgi:1-acyl-sn-glycerol-3-phosphate acyltransferase
MIKQLSTLIFQATGWKFENTLPDDLRSFIILGVPHTSNHDIIPALVASSILNRNTRFVIKDDWLKFPFDLILKPAGALGINREKLKEGKAATTDFMASLFTKYQDLVLMIAPEGTRSPTDRWKTGFYYIAEKAGVPIVLGYADYEKKIAGTGPIIYPRNFQEDMKKIMDFYKDIKGKRPANFLLDSRFS